LIIYVSDHKSGYVLKIIKPHGKETENSMKKKGILHTLILFITVFSMSFVVVYSLQLRKNDDLTGGKYRNTIYNSVSPISGGSTSHEEDSPAIFAKEALSEQLVAEAVADGTAVSTDNTAVSPSQNVAAQEKNTEMEAADVITQAPNGTKADTQVQGNFEYISVYNHKTDSVMILPLEEYVASVVVAEMPGNSPSEALKAQAVAARTLAVNYISEGNTKEHKGAVICTNSAHCQSYVSREDFTARYGENGKTVFDRAQNAANATKGLILLYNDQPIIAVFHASSGDSTASSKEVWGGELDYLVAVESTEIMDEALRTQVVTEVTFTREEFIQKLSVADIPELNKYKESPFHTWIGGKELTESGRVGELTIAGTKLSGRELRSILGLKSANFEISFGNDSITFITKGYGHGVGMSQLGAVSMAKNGESFYAILAKYYPGTIIDTV